MAKLEYRGSTDGNIPTPALDVTLDPAYFAVAKPNDPVKLNASGNVVLATATDPKLYGVLAAREYITRDATVKIGKVRTSRSALYEAVVSAGTPVPGTAYELTADGKVDASKTVNASVIVQKVLPGGNVLVTLA